MRVSVFLAGVTGIAMSGSSQALAQTVPPQAVSAETPATDDNDIVITAERRTSTVQKTPLAVTALDSRALEDRNITSVANIASFVPGVQVGSQTRETTVSIRGVSSQGVAPNQDASVGTYLDGVYLARPSGVASTFYDMERVEVLRGPQGTLYGRNTTAGALNYITAKPELGVVAGSAALTVGNYARVTGEGMLNVPLADSLAFRAAFQINRHDGYQKNTQAGQPDLADNKEVSARAHLLFQPDDQLRILLSGNYYHRGGAGSGYVNIGLPGFNPYRASTNKPHITDNTGYGFTAEISYAFSAATITSLSSYRNDYVDVTFDRDLTAVAAQSVRLFNPNVSLSQELRIASTGSSPLQYVAGAYYFQERNGDNVDLFLNQAGTIGFIRRDPAV